MKCPDRSLGGKKPKHFVHHTRTGIMENQKRKKRKGGRKEDTPLLDKRKSREKTKTSGWKGPLVPRGSEDKTKIKRVDCNFTGRRGKPKFKAHGGCKLKKHYSNE